MTEGEATGGTFAASSGRIAMMTRWGNAAARSRTVTRSKVGDTTGDMRAGVRARGWRGFGSAVCAQGRRAERLLSSAVGNQFAARLGRFEQWGGDPLYPVAFGIQ